MVTLEMIDMEINIVKNINITNLEELENLKSKYLSKSGIIPQFYKIIITIKGNRSNYYLNKMLDLRHAVDDKIRIFMQNL